MIDLSYEQLLAISPRIRNLRPIGKHSLVRGQDQLDLISYNVYGDESYWKALAIYNNILNPFDLIDSGISFITLFDKNELDLILKDIK